MQRPPFWDRPCDSILAVWEIPDEQLRLGHCGRAWNVRVKGVHDLVSDGASLRGSRLGVGRHQGLGVSG